jgi:hypothetical protein
LFVCLFVCLFRNILNTALLCFLSKRSAWLKSSVLRDVARRRLVVGYRHFGIICRLYHQESSNNIPEERKHELHCFGSLKWRSMPPQWPFFYSLSPVALTYVKYTTKISCSYLLPTEEV